MHTIKMSHEKEKDYLHDFLEVYEIILCEAGLIYLFMG
jgi:hypothetical protein